MVVGYGDLYCARESLPVSSLDRHRPSINGLKILRPSPQAHQLQYFRRSVSCLQLGIDRRHIRPLRKLEKASMAQHVRRLIEASSESLDPLVQEQSGGRYEGSATILSVFRAMDHKEQLPEALDIKFSGSLRAMQLDSHLCTVVGGEFATPVHSRCLLLRHQYVFRKTCAEVLSVCTTSASESMRSACRVFYSFERLERRTCMPVVIGLNLHN